LTRYATEPGAARSARITALLWLALLAGAGLVIHHSLRISGDLRLFMPAPHDAVGRLLLEEVSEGPAAKLLLLSIQGRHPRNWRPPRRN